MRYDNNYEKLKADFKKDTGLDAIGNVAIYIQYYNARMTDLCYQLNVGILDALRNPPIKNASGS